LLLIACIAIAYRRRSAPAIARAAEPPLITIAALALVAWPQLMRPLLEGDSLSYHLPNAASWVQSHGIWTTATRYWWYPPASELFVSGLYATGGPFALGWAGFGALALAGLRINAWARTEFEAPRWLADALAAAIVTVLPLALQGGTIQNDVWLAAFFLESLWLLRGNAAGAWMAVAICALVKPDGWLFAGVALVAYGRRPGVWVAAIVAMCAWALRDVLLRGHAIVPLTNTSVGQGTFHTTIIAHGLPALLELCAILLRTSPFALLALIFAVLAPFVLRGSARTLGWCALASTLLFLVLPFGYDNGDLQLATGASLRFAAPAIVLGGLLLIVPALRAPRIATILFALSALAGAVVVIYIFANDLPTLSGLAIAALAVTIAAVPRLRENRWLAPAGIGIAIIASAVLGQRDVLAFYGDALQVDGKKPQIYAWIAQTKPPSIAGWGVSLGLLNTISPSTHTIDASDDAACKIARDQRTLLVTVAESKHTEAENIWRLAETRACGNVLFDDGIGVVVKPL
jgi:hypothetical protein